MKSFFGICVLAALVAVGTTQPTHDSPHHDLGQTQHHMQPEHHMSQREHHMSQSEHRMSQQEHHMSQPEHHMSEPEYYPSQPQHHTQTEHQISQPNHYMSQPQHGYESWSNAETQAHAQSQRTWLSPEQQPYQPVEILSQPIIHAQPHIVHPQPLPIDPQLELHPYPYQHPHYPPIGSHHTQDTGLQYPTHGWNMQDSAVYQHPLAEPPAPEHHINSFKEDFPNQSSAFANAVVSANSVPVSNHEPVNPKLYKIIPIPKADDGADYIMPVAGHETRQPRIIQTSNDEGLPDIVQQILAKYRHIPIKIKPETKPDNAPSPKKRKPEGSVHRPHKHRKHKVPTIPVVTKQSAKTKAVAVSKTDTDKAYTIVTGGKHSTATKTPLKHIHKHSHKKVLKPLLDPELLAKELRLLSKELWVPSSDKTQEKDIPSDNNPIFTVDCTNPDDGDCNDGSNSLDKNKPKDKQHHEKHSDPHKSANMTPEKDMSEKTTKPSIYIEPDNKKDQKVADKDTNCDSASLDETTEPCNSDNAPVKEDMGKEHKLKPIINVKHNTNSKPVAPKIENKDITEKAVLQRQVIKKELKKEVPAKKEKIEQSPDFVPEMKKYNRKQNSKNDQKDIDKDNDWVSPSPDETTESCDDENDSKQENEEKKHVLIPKTDEKPLHDSEKNNPKNTFSHLHDKHSHHHTLTNIVPENDKAKSTTPSSNVKLDDQKNADRNNDCDSANSDETTEPCNMENAPEKEDKTKKHLLKPKTDKKNTDSKPEDNKGNTATVSDHDIVQEKEIIKKVTKQVEIKNKKIDQSPDFVPEMKKYNRKQNSKTDQKDIDKKNDWVSPSPDETTESCDDENDSKQENEEKKHVLIPKADEKPLHDSEKNNPKNTFSHLHDKHSHHHTLTNIVPENDKAKSTRPSSNVKLEDQKNTDRNNDCDSANSDETTEPCNMENAPEKEDKTKKHLPKPKTDKKNTDSKPVDNKGNTATVSDHEIVQEKKIIKKVTKQVEIKNKKIDQSPDFVPEMKKYNRKQNSKTDQKDIDKKNDWVSPSPDETTESCDDENDSKQENEEKKHVLIPKTDEKPLHDSEKNNPKNTFSHLHDKHSHHHTLTKIVPENDKAKSTTPSSNVKLDDQKNTDRNNDCDSANSDETTELCNMENAPETEDKTKKHLPKPKTEKTNTDSKPVDNKRNTATVSDHEIVQNKEVKTEMTKKVKTKKEKTVQQFKKIKQQPEKYDENQKQHYNTLVSDDYHSTERIVSHLPYDKTNASEYKDKREQSIPHTKKDDKKPQPVNSNKGNKEISNKNKPKDKLTKPKRDDEKYTDTKPVDNNKGKINATPDQKVVRIKEVKQKDTRKVDIRKEEIVQKSEKNKQQPETYNEKQKPVKPDYSTPVSDECDSTEGSLTQVPYDEIPAPEHKEGIKKPLPKATKDDNKPVSPDSDKGDKVIIIAKKDIEKVKQTREVGSKKEDKIYQTIKNATESKKYKDKLKPEKQENKSSDIEDCHSTESNERQKPLNKTLAQEYKKELKEPLPKENKDIKDLPKEKKRVDKKEVTVKIETKSKKSKKNVDTSEAVDKSKPVETSNENSDIDDCDSADAETDSKQDTTKINNEKNDAKKKKTEKVTKKTATKAKNKAEGKETGEELTSDEVAEILEKTETGQPLSTVGFLISLISHALQGSDSVKQMFEEPKVKTFFKDMIPLFHEKP